jgi:hypothetical protein
MGRFQIRYFAGAKTMYKNAGKDTVEISFLLWCG